MTTYVQLQQSAQSSMAATTRVTVQVGHCSQAVGAAQVAEVLGSALSGNPGISLVIAGCDGACFAAPQVLVTDPSGDSQRYANITMEDVPALIESFIPGNTAEQKLPSFVNSFRRRIKGGQGGFLG